MGTETLIWDADNYNKSNGAQYRDAKETLELIVQDGANKPDMIVVDIGCGSGNVTNMVATTLSFSKMYSSDFDSQMVQYAKEKGVSKNIEYFVQDISLPWEQLDQKLKNLEGKVDLVWSNRVLHWVEDKKTAVDTISRLLKKDGRLYINITLMRHQVEFASDKKEFERYFKFIPNQEQLDNWDNLFKNCGLSEANLEFIEKEWLFENEKQKSQMFTALDPYFRNNIATKSFNELSEEDQDDWINRVKEWSFKTSRTPYGKNPDVNSDKNGLKLYYEQIRVVGTK